MSNDVMLFERVSFYFKTFPYFQKVSLYIYIYIYIKGFPSISKGSLLSQKASGITDSALKQTTGEIAPYYSNISKLK